jgi:hypothetical protein
VCACARQVSTLDTALAQDDAKPDVDMKALYEELCEEVISMQTMALPSEIAAAIEDKESSPQLVNRSLGVAADRTRAHSGGASTAASVSVSRGVGFEQAVLAHLGTMADAMAGIASALGAKPKAVAAALQVLSSLELEGDEATDDEEEAAASTLILTAHDRS